MPKVCFLFVFLLVTTSKSFAIEPTLDQQAMVYFNMSFDAGHTKKPTYDFGLRFDRGLVQPGEMMMMNQLISKPAAFNLKLNKYGVKALELNGVDFAEEYYVYHGAETDPEVAAETTDKPKKKTKSLGEYIDKAPTGVLIGIVIATIAIADSTSSN